MIRRLFTSSASRLRRSVLYMPASNERALEKAKTIPADGFIFDLEDAVAPSSKNEARERAVKAANSKSYGNSEVIIRINGIDTEWFEEDVAAVCTSDADAVLLPKTNSSDDVETLRDEMSKHSTKEMDIWCMIETPKGVSEAMKIANRDDVTCLCMGTVDLANDLHCNPSVPERWNLQMALQTCVMSARANDIVALDSVFIDIQNKEGFRAECVQGRDLGFDGKTVIHPNMIDTANEIFSPNEKEIQKATKIIQAHKEAQASGSGVATVDGKLVEELHVRGAQRILDLASASGSL